MNLEIVMDVHLLKRDVFNPPDSPVTMARRTPQWEFDMHTHDFSELVVIVSGKSMHLTENETYPVQRGDVLLSPPIKVMVTINWTS